MINRYNSLLSKCRAVRLPVACARDAARAAARSAGAETLCHRRRRRTQPDRAAVSSANATIGKIDRCGVPGAALDRRCDSMRWRVRREPAGAVDSPIGTRPRAIPSSGIGDTVIDTGPHQLHAEGHNRPVRGHDRLELDRPQRQLSAWSPEQYGGIDFTPTR